MTYEFKHPKYYKELRKRNKLAESRQPVVGGQQQSDQVISETKPTGDGERAPGQGLKLELRQKSSSVNQQDLQAPSTKHQASSKPEPVQVQASSIKRQA